MEQFPTAENVNKNNKIPEEKELEKTYDFPPEEYLTPNTMPKNEAQEAVGGYTANFVEYQNMMGEVMQEHVMRKQMSDEEIEALAVEMVTEYEENTGEIEKAETEKIIEATESENKQEIEKQKENKEMSVFSQAVDLMKEYLIKYPKVAKLMIVGTLACELGNNPAMAYGEGESMINYGIQGMERSAYAQMQGREQAMNAQMQAQSRATNAQMQGEQRAQMRYQRDMQGAEQERQRGYFQLDNDQGRISEKKIFQKRVQIDQQYAAKVGKTQEQYRFDMQALQINQQQIYQQNQMRQEQIRMQTQMRQQQIQMQTGSRVVNTALRGILQGVFHGR